MIPLVVVENPKRWPFQLEGVEVVPARQYLVEPGYSDLRGTSAGHFVALYGYHAELREVLVADPLRENPRFGDQHYSVGVHRLVGAIMLGVLTYDGNLLVLEPPPGRARVRPLSARERSSREERREGAD